MLGGHAIFYTRADDSRLGRGKLLNSNKNDLFSPGNALFGQLEIGLVKLLIILR